MSLTDVWSKWKDKASRSLKKRGVAGTAGFVPVYLARLLWARYSPREQWFRYLDRRFAVDTAGTLFLPELRSDPRFKYSNEYGPTPAPLFFRILRQIDADFRRFVFIDFGCGKGKALLLASQLPFQQIIGIELSSKLIRIAEDNLRGYLGKAGKHDRFRLVCMDASEFQIPHEPAILYFANPFRAEVMSQVLGNIRRSLAAAPREIYFVYLVPVHQGLLVESGFLTPVKRTFWYVIYKASGI
ncbi:MAG: hypothetical protein A3J28_08480 [Acidobacteria bacterium RIFCSPLOWO2_12_FULL_60_22]|nr:MAG: hypothetical protein A3J28_08480 [Acidobacteria bacterium RIFCSPLOWO2_12_FULL_60_22]